MAVGSLRMCANRMCDRKLARSNPGPLCYTCARRLRAGLAPEKSAALCRQGCGKPTHRGRCERAYVGRRDPQPELSGVPVPGGMRVCGIRTGGVACDVLIPASSVVCSRCSELLLAELERMAGEAGEGAQHAFE